MPILKNDERLYVYLQGNHFQQHNVLTSNNDQVLDKNVVNIYIVYKLDPLASTRDKSYTIQNALFGAMQITKNATDYDKNNYKGYGICFDERSEFGHTITEGGHAHTTDARNVLIFGADMSFSVHAINRANHIHLMDTDLTQGINDTTIYAEKNFYRNFTDFGKKIVLSLHYNGDNGDIKAIPNNVINIYCVYELDPIDFSRNDEFTIQNALFGAIEITKNEKTSKYEYKGYGICLDESESFSHVRKEGNFNHTTLARNVIIFGVDMSFSKHANNKANNIYVMGKDYITKINDTTIYAEKMLYRNFTEPGKKFILSLHYNGDNSYLFVNGREEL